ncbi:hypothetical protein KKG83_01920 [Candidatus Micrarchaeota archaeon]|nr:hypothetical protein [Candidatus Micrarchaeota archaeon]MBU2476207.1 hypothetical protein [Candidatus Micrarchaeota archaeon]
MIKKFHELETKHQLVVALLVAFAVVSFWRGVWGLMDVHLIPQDIHISYWASLIIGLFVLILTGYATKELM